MNKHSGPHALVTILGLLALSLLIGPAAARTTLPEERSLRDVWRNARESGAYHFSVDIQQTIAPKPTILNVGRESKQDAVHLEGETNMPDRQLHLTLWSQGGSVANASTGIEIKIEDERALARRGPGDWQEINNFVDVFAPQGDFMAFLAAARDVERVAASGERDVTPRSPLYAQRYKFRIDGASYAAYLRDQMEQYLAEKGELPSNVRLDLSKTYVDMTGDGELWVSENGLPVRQILRLRLPSRDDSQDVHAEVTVDFSNFRATQVGGISNFRFPISDLAPIAYRLSLIAGVSLFSLAIAVYGRSRKLYAAIVLVVSVSMVVTPLMESAQAAGFADRQAAKEQAATEREKESDMEQTLNRFLAEPQFNPNVNPLDAVNLDRALENGQSSDAGSRMMAPLANPQSATNNQQSSSSVTDCDADDARDDDNDGLTNGNECVLGTAPDVDDSDNDGIKDGDEVKGFKYNDKMWYTNPLEADTNKDGLDDGREWRTGNKNDGDPPPDMDGDGTPDLFDLDNDGDGVPDNLDLSPYYKGDQTFTDQSPFELVLDNLEQGQPTLVEFQLRPTNPKHLWYAFNVLDWPNGDRQGQMQDADGQTFYDVDNNTSRSPNDNGDVKVIPMLELRITGDPDNLPSDTCEDDEGQPYTCYPELDNYGVSVRKLKDDGSDKAVYVPLQLIVNPTGGERVAFAGKMKYRPAAQWGKAHQARLVWLVQALVDVCAEFKDGQCSRYDKMNDTQLVQTYPDDWRLTGLSVREEHGTDVALAYEDPDIDNDLNEDTALQLLAHGLEYTFLAGSDCEKWDDKGTSDPEDDECVSGNGERDLELPEIYRRWNHATNSGVPVTQTWHISNVLSVITRTYTTADEALMTIAMTETKQILDNHFTAHWSSSAPISPTLMFAREERYRALNLDENRNSDTTLVRWSSDGHQLTLDLKPSDVEQQTVAGLNWAPYKYKNSEWMAYPIEDFWKELERRYNKAFSAEFSDDSDPEAARGGAVLVGQVYYLALYNGVSVAVQVGDEPLKHRWQSADKPIEARLANVGSKAGVVFILNRVFLRHFFESTADLKQLFSEMEHQKFFKSQTLFSGVKQGLKNKYYNLLAKSWHKTRLTLTALAVVGVLVLIAVSIYFLYRGYVNGNAAAKITAAVLVGVALTAVTLVLPILQIINLVRATMALRGLTAAAATGRVLKGSCELVGMSKKAGVVGLIIAVGIVWGVFIYAVTKAGVQPGSVAFDMLLAQTIAATILAVILFVVSLTVIGTLIVAVITLVDMVLTLLGSKWTISGALTDALTRFLFSFELAINEKDKDLVKMGMLDSKLVHPELGMMVGAEFEFSTVITTAVTHKNPKDIRTILYLWKYDRDQLRSTSFRYRLDEQGRSLSVSLWDTNRTHTWRISDDHEFLGHTMYTGWITDSLKAVSSLDAPGVNRTVPLVLTTAYALPGVECWSLILPTPFGFIYIPICVDKSIKGSTTTDMGANIVMDVFPKTLDEFMNVGEWAPGAVLRDADGDGLIARAYKGDDPDDTTWDADGDGLSDAWEMQMASKALDEGGYFYDPRNADTDGDGLDDGQEARLGTNPNNPDTDGDSLTDADEVLNGWEFTYAEGKTLRVYSSPLEADWDGDGMDDLFERTLHTCPDCDPLQNRYYPYTWNNSPIGLYTKLGEDDGVLGPGQAMLYTTTVQNNLNPPLWVRGDTDLARDPLSGGPTTMFFDLPRNASQSLYSNLSVPASAGSQDVTLETDLNSQLHTPSVWAWDPVTTMTRTTTTQVRSNAVAVAPVSNWSSPYVAASLEYSRVLVYRATAESITGDGVLAIGWGGDSSEADPDIACNAQGTCLVVWASSNNVDDKNYFRWRIITPTMESPGAVGTVTISPTVGVRGASVASDGSTFLAAWKEGSGSNWQGKLAVVDAKGNQVGPTLELDTGDLGEIDLAWSSDRYQVVWEKSKDIHAADVMAQTVQNKRAIASASAEETSPRIAYDTLSQRALATYVSKTGNKMSLRGRVLAGGMTSDEFNIANLELAVARHALSADPINGGWIAAWGRLSDSKVYYQAIGMDGGLRGQRQTATPGSNTAQLALVCAAPRPAAQLRFDEDSGATRFADSSGFGRDGTCSGSACPLSGVGGKSGNAVQFDSSNDVVMVPMDVSETSYGVTLWFKTTCQTCGLYEVSNNYTPGTGGYNADRTLYLSRGNLCARVGNRFGGDNRCTEAKGCETICTSGESYADGLWHQAAHTFGGSVGGQRLYVDGDLKASGKLASSNYTGQDRVRIGYGEYQYGTYLDGVVDEVTVYPRALSAGEVSDSYRAATAIYPFDEAKGATSFENAARNGYTGSCSGSGCPTAGVEGRAYAAAQFDGSNDVVRIANQPRTIAEYVYDFESGVPTAVWSHVNWTHTPNGNRAFLGRFGNDEVTLSLSGLPDHDQAQVEFDLFVINSWDGNRTTGGNGPDYWEWSVDGARQKLTTFTNYDPPYFYQFYPDEPWTPSGVWAIYHNNCDRSSRDTLFKHDDPDFGNDPIGRDAMGCYSIYGDTAARFYSGANYGGSREWGCDGKVGNCESFRADDARSVRVWAAANAGFTGAQERNTLGYNQSAVYHFSQSLDHVANTIQVKFKGWNLESLDNESWGLDNVVVRLNNRNVPLANSSFSVGFWARRDQAGRNDYIFSQGKDAANQNLFVGFWSDNKFVCGFDTSSNLLATTGVYTDTDWHHWACTYDASTRKRTIYRDGAQVAQDTAPAHYQGFGLANIGKATWGNNFSGRIDELAVWGQALSAQDIKTLYEKVKVVDDSVTECALPRALASGPNVQMNRIAVRETTTLLGKASQTKEDTLTIDARPPTATLTSLVNGQHLAVTGTLVIGGEARDNTAVAQVQVSVDSGAWQTAEGAESWSFGWDTSALGEGAHTLSVRAIDAGSNTGAAMTITVVIDRTPPQLARANNPQQAVQNERGLWTVPLSGTVSDASMPVSVQALLEGQADVAGSGWQTATVGGAAWNVSYVLPSFDNSASALTEPTGVYTVHLRGSDSVDNNTESAYPPVLQLDNTAPETELTYPYSDTHILTDTAIAATGLVTDVGVVASGAAGVQVAFVPREQADAQRGTVLRLLFDESAGMQVFADSSGYSHRGSCQPPHCPTAGISGKVDGAVSFDGYDDVDVPDSALLNITDTLTLAAWVNLTSSDREGKVIGKTQIGDGYLLGIDVAGRLYPEIWDNTGQVYSGTWGSIPTSQWTHLAVTWKTGGWMIGYINGQEVGRIPASVYPIGVSTSTLRLGAPPWDPNASTFIGLMDDAAVYNRALESDEVRVLYESANLSWSSAALAQPGAVTSSWTYSMPSGVEGPYEIYLRGADVLGNRNDRPGTWSAWQGDVDMSAPAVSATVQYVPIGVIPNITYQSNVTCLARDVNLDGASFSGCPCEPTTWRITTYDQVSPWYRRVTTDTTRLYEIQAACARVGQFVSPPTVRACDLAGHCSQTAMTSTLLSTPILYSAILTPTDGTVFTTVVPFAVQGKAYAASGLQAVTVTVNGGNWYNNTWPFPGSLYQDLNLTYTPAGEGRYRFESLVSDWAGAVQTVLQQPITVTVDATPPTTPTFATTVITTAHRSSQGVAILSGVVTDAVGLRQIQVNPNDIGWLDASHDGVNWRMLWKVGDGDPDGETYTVTVRATDFALRTVTSTAPIVFDMTPPAPVTVTLAYTDNLGLRRSLAPHQTITDGNRLIIEWTPSSDGSGVSGYLVGWNTSPTTTADAVFVPHPLTTYAQLVGEAQAWYAHHVSLDIHGNQREQVLGPVFVDSPLTPDLIQPYPAIGGGTAGGLDYHAWMDSGCAQLGVDRRVSDRAATSASLNEEQKFYTTWDTDTLRLMWTGANWNTEGDLFIYLDTRPGGATMLYNPYTATQTNTVIYLPGNTPAMTTTGWADFDVIRQSQMITSLLSERMDADYVVWAQDDETALLMEWNGSAWITSTTLSVNQYQLVNGVTDVALPFSSLGITYPATTTLKLLAAASEENALRLWAVMPERNLVDSQLAVNPLSAAETQHVYVLTRAYRWSGLGSGVCPYQALPWMQALAFVDSDLRASLTAEPVGTTYALMADDLFAQWQTLFQESGVKSQRFAFLDNSHPPVGQGQVITYTLRVANHGTSTATGVKALVSAYYGLHLPGGVSDPTSYREYQIVDVGDVTAGAVVTRTLAGVVEVDSNWRYTLCMTKYTEDVCRAMKQGAALDGWVFDSRNPLTTTLGITVPLQPPVEWLWADHAVDIDPPQFVGIEAPLSVVGPLTNTVRGYASDPSGVPLVEVEVRDSLGATTMLTCPDATPYDGQWSCDWNVIGDDGDEFDLRARATDGLGHVSAWTSPWRNVVLDATPPTVTLDSDVHAAVQGQFIGPGGYLLTGVFTDDHSSGAVQVCRETDAGPLCELATTLLAAVAPTSTASVYDDVPGAPIAITTTTFCGGGEFTRTFNVTDTFIVGDVDLGFNATHDWRDDIMAELVSPSGTHARVILGDLADVFQNYDVWLDDAAPGPLHNSVDDDTTEPYFDRPARPYEPLSAFNGEPVSGTWQLIVCDINPLASGGTYNRSRLSLTPQGAVLPTAGTWSYPLPTPSGVDGVTQTLAIYGMDDVGNRTAQPISLSYRLDTVAPVLTVTTVITWVPQSFPSPVLAGQVSDGGEMEAVYLRVDPPDSASYRALAQQTWVKYRVYLPLVIKSDASFATSVMERASSGAESGAEEWVYVLRSDTPGPYTLWVEAYDKAGNVVQMGPYQVGVAYQTYLPIVMR